MKRLNKLILAGLALGVVAAAIVMGLALTRPVRSDEGIISSPDGSYEYAVRRERGKVTEITVLAPQTAPAWEKYREANARRAEALLQAGRAEHIRVAITFAQPLSLDEARALLEAARVEGVENYSMAGYNRQGQKAGFGVFGSLPASTQEVTQMFPGYEAKGVIVIIGYVWSTPDSLGQLLADPRVYIADVTEYEIRERLGLGSEEVLVMLLSPFWNLW